MSVVSLLFKIWVRSHGYYSHLAGCPAPSSTVAQQESDGFHWTGLPCGSSHHSAWPVSSESYFNPLLQWPYNSVCPLSLLPNKTYALGMSQWDCCVSFHGRSGRGLVGFWDQLAFVDVDLSLILATLQLSRECRKQREKTKSSCPKPHKRILPVKTQFISNLWKHWK